MSEGNIETMHKEVVSKGWMKSTPAERALAEAEERRKAAAEEDKERRKDVGGRDRPEPTRYGDWEKGGIASDF